MSDSEDCTHGTTIDCPVFDCTCLCFICSQAKVYGGCISSRQLCRLNLDFSIKNVRTRKQVYRRILENVFNEKNLADTYIAGGGFLIHYNERALSSIADPDRFQALKNDEHLEVYVKYSKTMRLQATETFKRTLLHPNLATVAITNDDVNGHFKTIVVTDFGESVNVKGFFTVDTLFETLNSFTYEPCKIGFKYEGFIYMSKWFLCGGRMENTDLTPDERSAHNTIVENYKYKNIDEKCNRPIVTDTFFNINFV